MPAKPLLQAKLFVLNIGEITCSQWNNIDPEKIARDVVKIGYDKPEYEFAATPLSTSAESTASPQTLPWVLMNRMRMSRVV